MVSVKFCIRKELLLAVDALLEGKKMSRSSFINEAIEVYYGQWLMEEAERELAELYPENREISKEEEEWMDADLTTPMDE